MTHAQSNLTRPTMNIVRFLFLLLLPFTVIPTAWATEESELREETYKNLEVFSNVLMMMQQHYVDSIDPHEVITGAINGMLTSLDPHSSYLDPENFKELQDETHGSFSGIGIEITVKDGILTIVSPIEDTPAYRAGLKGGDQIIRIDNDLTKSMTLMEAVKRLRGKRGTEVKISVFRSGWQELKDFMLVRDEIPLLSVKSMVLDPSTFYIRISNFQANTTRDLLRELRDRDAEEPVRGLILDLRNNPGGLLDQAIKVADIFLDNGIIVSTRGRSNDQNLEFEAQPDEGEQYDFPMIVLVNGGSASASEIVAGALQDHKRAIILGTETFGKGSVQTIIPMADGAGLRLTTAKYYTPSGDSIQATGIKPDIIVPFIVPESDNGAGNNGSTRLREKDLPNHIENDGRQQDEAQRGNGDDEETDAAKRLQRDNQLRTALYILKGLEITGSQQLPDDGGLTGEGKE